MSVHTDMSVLFCIPFVGMLLSIALFPMIKPHWWEKNVKYVVLFWSLLFLIPFCLTFGLYSMAEELMHVVFEEYLTFIVLLFGLFCVTGNIGIKSEFTGSPRSNLIMLLIGTLLSSWIGTTGASMLMIRPLIASNGWRKHKTHTFVFFIFLVANIGGCLTPIGDPPLFMGFLRGVPFFWSLRIWPVLLINTAILLGIYMVIERKAYKKEIVSDLKQPTATKESRKIQIEGGHNFIFIGCIVAAIILGGALSSVAPFSDGIYVIGSVELKYSEVLEVAIILIATLFSFLTTSGAVRRHNEFSFEPIEEIAVLFIGIFITMVPALELLGSSGSGSALTHPGQFFWLTGGLSGFLDNTPTYLVFLTASGLTELVASHMINASAVEIGILEAISCGAVFMGALTYIGNAPNFMVKSIAEKNGIKMPSFFGYIKWAVLILVPVFLIDTIIFFH